MVSCRNIPDGCLSPLDIIWLQSAENIGGGGFGNRIGEHGYRQDNTENNSNQNQPKSRFSVIHHGSHPFLHAHLSKSQRAGGDHAAIDGTGHQSLGIVGTLFIPQLGDHLFVAGQFNVPAQENVGHPHQRIEPIDGQKQESQGLPPVIFPSDVRLLMGHHMMEVITVHAVGQVDSRFQNSQYEGRTNGFALENILPEDGRHAEIPTKPQISDGSIGNHNHHTNQPDHSQNGHYIGTVIGRDRYPFKIAVIEIVIYLLIHQGNSGLDIKIWAGNNLLREGLSTGNQAQCTFNGKRANQPHGHDAPQQDTYPLGCLLQGKSENQYRQNQPACGDAHIEEFKKCFGHLDHPPFRMRSIIFWTSSRSLSDRSCRLVKAATKAGKDPPNLDSTKVSISAASASSLEIRAVTTPFSSFSTPRSPSRLMTV